MHFLSEDQEFLRLGKTSKIIEWIEIDLGALLYLFKILFPPAGRLLNLSN